MKTLKEMTIGSRFTEYHTPYEKKRSRTAYLLEYNHLTHDYDFMPGVDWFYMGMSEPAKSLKLKA